MILLARIYRFIWLLRMGFFGWKPVNGYNSEGKLDGIYACKASDWGYPYKSIKIFYSDEILTININNRFGEL